MEVPPVLACYIKAEKKLLQNDTATENDFITNTHISCEIQLQ